MDRPLKIYLIIASVFVFVVVVSYYGLWEKKQKEESTLSYLDANDALLIRAKQKAHATLDTLFKLYPQYPAHSFIKFATKDDYGTEQHRWGLLKDLQPDHVSIILKDPGEGHSGISTDDEKEIQLPIEQVEDWQVEVDSGRVRGAFTTQVILLHHHGMTQQQADQQLSLCIDKL